MKRDFKRFNWIKTIEPYEVLLNKYPKSNFIWVDAMGGENDIRDMNSSHIYYTIRMIWNHMCNSDLIIDKKIDYDFSENKIYCDAYFKLGLKKMFEELNKRNNLEEKLLKNFGFIKDNINKILN